jgi:hypothetical protein
MTPSITDVFRAQLRLAAPFRRAGFWVASVYVLAQTFALAAFGTVFGVSVYVRGEETTISLATGVSELTDFTHASGAAEPLVAALVFAAVCLSVWALVWPFRIWRGERPSRRDYHRSMPVDRRLHDLIRVASGGLWLLGIEVVVVLTAVSAAAMPGRGGVLPGIGPLVWASLILGPMILYLAGSAVLIRSEHPAAWVVGGILALLLSGSLAQMVGAGLGRAVDGIAFGPSGLLTVLFGPVWFEAAARPGPAPCSRSAT